MIAKNNRLNHDFQILYFLVGKCHTPDAAYAILKDLQQDRMMALNKAKSNELRTKARRIDIERRLQSDDEVERLEAEADLMDFENEQSISELNVKAAQKELDFINKLLEEIQPYRKYKDLPDDEAFELCQQEEWKYELLDRARNQLLLTGTISPEDFSNILSHPEANDMIESINTMIDMIKLPDGSKQIMKMLTKPSFIDEIENKLMLENKQNLKLLK